MMVVPDKSQFAREFLGPRLRLVVDDIEATRTHSFAALNAGCLELRKTDPRWGLLEKTGGAQVRNRAADIWLYDLGDGTAQVVDVIGNAEGDGNQQPVPAWGVKDIRPVSQWREPYGAVTPPPDPPPPTPPPPDPGDIAEITKRIRELEAEIKALDDKISGAALDSAEAMVLAKQALDRVVGLKLVAAPELPDSEAISTNQVWGHAHRLKARIV